MKNKDKEEWKFSFKKILIASILICSLPRLNLVYSRFFKSKRDTYQDIMYVKPKKFWEVNLEKKRVKDGH